MRPCRFERSIELPASVERVFAFHADPRNIPHISPRWQRVRVVAAEPTAYEQTEFEIHVCFFGLIPLRWRGVWCRVQPPNFLVDEALRSPFAYWRHQHEFHELGPFRTRLIDRVDFLLAGPFSWLVSRTVGWLQMSLMFADRQARTRDWLREHP